MNLRPIAREVAVTAGLLVTLPLLASAQPGRPLSLEQAMESAIPVSEALELAKAAVLRARGEQYRANADRFPQLSASLGYNRLLASQFEGIDFGGSSPGDSGSDGGQLPFGRANTYNLGLSLSQTLFAGGRIAGQTASADAGHRSAALGVTAAEAQLTLDVVSAYYDAVLADQQLNIALATLAQADSTVRQAALRQAVGAEAEFEVLRARVTRNNQNTSVILRRNEREVAYLRLKQLLGVPADDLIILTTTLGGATFTDPPIIASLVASPTDTTAESRIAVRQAAEAVRVQEGVLQVAKAQRIPSLVLTSQYGKVGYPDNYNPTAADYATNWNMALGVQVPIFTGGRTRGDKVVAQAALREAELRLAQATKLARLETRTALSALEAATAAWEASQGTVEEAERAYRIAELRYREGLSTQTELVDSRIGWQTAEISRVQAARELQVARVRVALISDLPLNTGAPVVTAPRQTAQAPARQNAPAQTQIPGTTP